MLERMRKGKKGRGGGSGESCPVETEMKGSGPRREVTEPPSAHGDKQAGEARTCKPLAVRERSGYTTAANHADSQ